MVFQGSALRTLLLSIRQAHQTRQHRGLRSPQKGGFFRSRLLIYLAVDWRADPTSGRWAARQQYPSVHYIAAAPY